MHVSHSGWAPLHLRLRRRQTSQALGTRWTVDDVVVAVAVAVAAVAAIAACCGC